jgi:hypothetical protein
VLIMSARALIEQEPNYSYVAARLLLDTLRHEALSCLSQQHESGTCRVIHRTTTPCTLPAPGRFFRPGQ